MTVSSTRQLIPDTTLFQILTADDGPSVYEFGKGIVDAAAAAGVERVVYSTMPNASQISDGLVSIEFFDGMWRACAFWHFTARSQL